MKNDSSPIASTMSGTTAGRNTALSSAELLTVRSSPRASRVPSTTEITVTTVATNTVFFSASNRSWLSNSSRYHWVENPPHVDVLPDPLNESTISTRIGA